MMRGHLVVLRVMVPVWAAICRGSEGMVLATSSASLSANPSRALLFLEGG